MLVLGTLVAIPASILAASAPSVGVLVAARIFGGLAAGMAYPDDTRADHRAVVRARPHEGDRPVVRHRRRRCRRSVHCCPGALLEHHAWGSVFLITLPFAALAAVMAILLVPSHVNETTDPVDNTGGILSIVAIAALVLAINFAPVPNKGTRGAGSGRARARRAGDSSICARSAPGFRCSTCTWPHGASSGSRRWAGSSCSAA